MTSHPNAKCIKIATKNSSIVRYSRVIVVASSRVDLPQINGAGALFSIVVSHALLKSVSMSRLNYGGFLPATLLVSMFNRIKHILQEYTSVSKVSTVKQIIHSFWNRKHSRFIDKHRKTNRFQIPRTLRASIFEQKRGLLLRVLIFG